MQKFLLSLIVISCCFSCKKSKVDNSSSYYIKTMANGVEKTFSDNTIASEYSGDISVEFTMSAKSNLSNETFTLGIIHPFGIKITTGVYKEVSNGYVPSGSYAIADSAYGSGFVSNISTIQITISALTNTTAIGTFAGKLYNRLNANDSLIITDGMFNLPIH